MWKEFLWKSFNEISIHTACEELWKTPQGGCGEKYVAALRKIEVIHISFLYRF